MKDELDWIQAEVKANLDKAAESNRKIIHDFNEEQEARKKIEKEELKFTLADLER